MLPDLRDGSGAYDLPESAAHIQRNAYTPYGSQRALNTDMSDDSPDVTFDASLSIERGWLSQVADEATSSLGTGLTYLNARYYDPLTSRFLSPDPLLNVMDPKTLDPYRYAENNPVFYSDATGLYAKKDEEVCGHYGCAGKTDDPFTYGVGLNGKEAKGKVKSFTTACTGPRKQQHCTTLEPWEVRARLNHASAEAKCAMGIASGSCEHINANTHFSGTLSFGEIAEVSALGFINFSSGVANAATGTVNGLADIAVSGVALLFGCDSGLNIPKIAVVGDPEFYGYSQTSGGVTFDVGTLLFGGGTGAATIRLQSLTNVARSAWKYRRGKLRRLQRMGILPRCSEARGLTIW